MLTRSADLIKPWPFWCVTTLSYYFSWLVFSGWMFSHGRYPCVVRHSPTSHNTPTPPFHTHTPQWHMMQGAHSRDLNGNQLLKECFSYIWGWMILLETNSYFHLTPCDNYYELSHPGYWSPTVFLFRFYWNSYYSPKQLAGHAKAEPVWSACETEFSTRTSLQCSSKQSRCPPA